MARCLVLGGNGFLGSHVVDALVEDGHDVTVFDRFGLVPISFRAIGVSTISGNFLSRSDLAEALAEQEIVLHLVSTTDPATAEDDPLLDVRTNLASTIDLLELCVQVGVRRVLFASTGGAIYGDQPRERFDEEALTEPFSPYSIGKLAVEGYLRYFKKKWGLESTAMRISNPYGPRQNPRKRQGVIPIFLRHIADDQPITVLGDGRMIRDYIYATDVARMVSALVRGPTTHPLYNLGSGTGVSLSHLIEVIESVTGRDVTIQYRPKPATFVDHVVLDTSRFRTEFGDMSATSLAEGVRLTWEAVLDEPYA